MAGVIFIAVAGIFVIGVVSGIIVVVSYGIHHEEARFRKMRRFQEEHGLWDEEEHFLAEDAPDGASWAARRLNGLYVRHMRSPERRDAGQDIPV